MLNKAIQFWKQKKITKLLSKSTNQAILKVAGAVANMKIENWLAMQVVCAKIVLSCEFASVATQNMSQIILWFMVSTILKLIL